MKSKNRKLLFNTSLFVCLLSESCCGSFNSSLRRRSVSTADGWLGLDSAGRPARADGSAAPEQPE